MSSSGAKKHLTFLSPQQSSDDTPPTPSREDNPGSPNAFSRASASFRRGRSEGLNVKTPKSKQQFSNSLHRAAREGDLDAVVQYLEDEGVEDVNTKDATGCSPLALAAKAGSEKVLSILIDAGASVSSSSPDGNTALHWCCMRGRLKAAQFLLSKGAQVDAMDKWGWQPIHWACEGGRLDLVNALFASGASPSALTNTKRSPAHIASFYGHVDILEVLSNRGADLFLVDDDGKVPGTDFHDKVNLDTQNAIKRVLTAANAPRLQRDIGQQMRAMADRLDKVEADAKAAREEAAASKLSRDEMQRQLEQQQREMSTFLETERQCREMCEGLGQAVSHMEGRMTGAIKSQKALRSDFSSLEDSITRTLSSDLQTLDANLRDAKQKWRSSVSDFQRKIEENEAAIAAQKSASNLSLQSMVSRISSTEQQMAALGTATKELSVAVEATREDTSNQMRQVSDAQLSRWRRDLDEHTSRCDRDLVDAVGRSESAACAVLTLTRRVDETDSRLRDRERDLECLQEKARHASHPPSQVMEGALSAIGIRLAAVEAHQKNGTVLSERTLQVRLEMSVQQLKATSIRLEQLGVRVVELEEQLDRLNSNGNRHGRGSTMTPPESSRQIMEMSKALERRIEEMRSDIESQVRRAVDRHSRSVSDESLIKDQDVRVLTHLVVTAEGRLGDMEAEIGGIRDRVTSLEHCSPPAEAHPHGMHSGLASKVNDFLSSTTQTTTSSRNASARADDDRLRKSCSRFDDEFLARAGRLGWEHLDHYYGQQHLPSPSSTVRLT